MKDEAVLRAVIKRPEERDALNVVPVKVRDENVRYDRLPLRLMLQLLTE